MKYEAWRRSRTIEAEFLNSLNYLVDLFNKIAQNSDGDVDKYVNRMRNFQNSYPYEKFIYSMVKNMVTPLAVANMRTWRRAARKATKGRKIYDALMDEIKLGLEADIKSQIVSNAELIRTLPTDTARKVVYDIYDLTLSGERATTIAQIISKETNKHARASARLIARTEVSKTTTALTRARAENLGLKWYVWRTAEDGDRVRVSHRIMDDVLVNWLDPPSPEVLVGEKDVGRYHAGNIWNCRCYPEPLIELDDIQWPHKMFRAGKIQTVGKKQFELIV